MADKKIQMKLKNGANWDNLFPKTKSELVEGLPAAITTEVSSQLTLKVDKVAGKGLSTEDYSTSEKSKLAGIAAGAQVNTVTSVAGKSGSVTVAKADVGLGNVDNFGTATQAESEAGTVTNKFMTPQRTAQAIAALGTTFAPVQSVAGKFGTVTLTKADVGLGNVDNTSDASKPVSTAQQTAFNLKANIANPVLTGTPSAPTAATTTNSTQIATTAYVKNQGYSKISLSSSTPTDANVDIWYEELT